MKNIIGISLLSAALVAPVVYAEDHLTAFHNNSNYTMVVKIYNYNFDFDNPDFPNQPVPHLSFVRDITLTPNQFLTHKLERQENGAYPVIGDVQIQAPNEANIYDQVVYTNLEGVEVAFKDAVCSIDNDGLHTKEAGVNPGLVELSYIYNEESNFSIFDCETGATAWRGDK
jgi:hypothetical protein